MVAVRKDGNTVVDHQGDWITEDDLEDAAYDFVLESAGGPVSGEQHDKSYPADGYLIESVVFTAEKLAKMGIAPDGVDRGHWIGLFIPDDEAYERVRDGEKSMLSIEASGYREECEPPGPFVVAEA